jgi:predicted amidohydrolase YtcJ
MPRAFTGGTVLTMVPGANPATALVIDGDRIVAAGGPEIVPPDADIVELAGATLTPGFIDAHNHLSIAALHPVWNDVHGVTDGEVLVDAIRAQAAAEPETAWVRCQGIDVSVGLPVTRHDLDAAGVDRPVIVADYTLHQCVVSSAGLDALGIGRSTPDPAGGEIRRGADGEATGLLLERAWSVAHASSMGDYADPSRWSEHIAARARVLLAHGITCVHDAACPPQAEAIYRAMARAGALPLSVLAMPHPSALLTNDHRARLDGPPSGEGDEWCRVGAIKLFADGGVAIAVDATIQGNPVRFGIRFGDLEEHARAAVEHGFRIAIHAMGNVGVDAMLDTCTELARAYPGRDHRFRVEHAGVTSPEQWSRLADLDAVAVVQPGFVEHVGTNVGEYGFDHHHWLAFAGLAEAGVTLAGSSDDPCAPVPPLWCMTRGVQRRTSGGRDFEPEQSVPFDDWLVAYTRGAAFAGGQERERGMLAPDFRADLVVLERNGSTARVRETWVAGERVHADGSTLPA